MSTVIQITPKSGITVGSTAIDSGTDTRILFQNGGVVSQSSMLTFNDTGVSGSTTANFANTFNRTGNNFRIYGNNGATTLISSEGGGSGLYANSTYEIVNTSGNNFNFRIGTGSPVSAMYINSSLNVGVGTTSPSSRLDVKAQGALSTDVVQRWRNSADTANIGTVNGNGTFTFGTYTNPNTRLSLTSGTTLALYCTGAGTGAYFANEAGTGTAYAAQFLGRQYGAGTPSGYNAYGILTGADTTNGINYGLRSYAYNGATNYAAYLDSAAGTTNWALYIQRGDILFGTATTNKIGFWNATPIVQPTTAIASATFVANTSLIANDTATFDGYTIGQVVKALRNIGILA